MVLVPPSRLVRLYMSIVIYRERRPALPSGKRVRVPDVQAVHPQFYCFSR